MTPQIFSKRDLAILAVLFISFAQAQVAPKSAQEKSAFPNVIGSAGLNNSTNEIDMIGEVLDYIDVIEKGFVYRIDGQIPTISDTKITSENVEKTFSYKLTDLLPNTIYHVRPYATNINGTTYGSLSKIDTREQASIEITLKEKIKTYPNPSTNYISLSGLLETKNYMIYSMRGKELARGSISNDNKIDVRFLEDGLYLLKLEGFEIIKFIKE